MEPNKNPLKRMNGAACVVTVFLGVLLLLPAGCRKEAAKSAPVNQPTATYSVTPSTIQVGDPVQLILTTWCPIEGTVELPEPGRGKEIVVLNRERNPLPPEEGFSKTEIRYTLTSFRPGEHLILSGPAIFHLSDGTTVTNALTAGTLTVDRTLNENNRSTLADIKPVQSLPHRIPRWLWIVIGGALLAFLAGLLTARFMKQRETTPASVPPVPAHLIALQALALLEKSGLLEQEQCDPFYTQLSSILRTYLEGRFLLNAPDKTTEEIVVEMSQSNELNGLQRAILHNFMQQADLVKFARRPSDSMTMRHAFGTVHHFVDETKLLDETEPTTPNQPPPTPDFT